MPLRRLTGRHRSPAANWQLAALLAFTAGAVDVTGYLALHRFTSHMSGIVAVLAADLGTHGLAQLIAPAASLFAFLVGAAACAVLVNWERRRNREGLFAVPVLLEACLLAALALPAVHTHPAPLLLLLSFSMGLQNAAISKISHAEIRTTHVTGMVTDIGIELGKALYWNRSPQVQPVRSDRTRLFLLTLLVTLFFAGGTAGALAYPHFGFAGLLPLALLLAAPTVLPIAADLRALHAGTHLR